MLAPAVGGIPDLIQHSVTGLILPEIDPDTIERSLRAAIDRSDLASIAERGRKHRYMERLRFVPKSGDPADRDVPAAAAERYAQAGAR